jgi:hypothetical protein
MPDDLPQLEDPHDVFDFVKRPDVAEMISSFSVARFNDGIGGKPTYFDSLNELPSLESLQERYADLLPGTFQILINKRGGGTLRRVKISIGKPPRSNREELLKTATPGTAGPVSSMGSLSPEQFTAMITAAAAAAAAEAVKPIAAGLGALRDDVKNRPDPFKEMEDFYTRMARVKEAENRHRQAADAPLLAAVEAKEAELDEEHKQELAEAEALADAKLAAELEKEKNSFWRGMANEAIPSVRLVSSIVAKKTGVPDPYAGRGAAGIPAPGGAAPAGGGNAAAQRASEILARRKPQQTGAAG